MFCSGDWVIDKSTGKIGILHSRGWSQVVVRFGSIDVLRYPDMIELAPLDIRKEDLIAMQHLAVNIGDKAWFNELSKMLSWVENVRED